MSHSKVQEYFHLIWSAGDQRSWLAEALRDEVRRYLTAVARNCQCSLLDAVAMDNHVHLLLRLEPTQSLSNVVQKIKAGSSPWLKQKTHSQFHWEKGFTAFSVTPELVGKCQSFFDRQYHYHSVTSYADELRALLMLHQIDFQEKYLIGSSYSMRLVHMVWATQERESWLDDTIRPEVWMILKNIAVTKNITVLEIGGFYDHVHLLLRVPPKYALSDVAQCLKSLSTRELRARNSRGPFWQWQDGYGAFSVSRSKREVVANYIQNQMEHHRSVRPSRIVPSGL